MLSADPSLANLDEATLRQQAFVISGQPGQVRALMPYPLPSAGLAHSLFIRDGRKLHRVAVREMLHLEADGNYVELVMAKGRFVLRNSMSEVIKSLPEDLFAMVNRKQAVNLLLVDSVSTDEVTIGRLSYTISPRYREQLLERLHVVSGR